MTQESTEEKQTKPLLPFIKVPDNYPDEAAYIWGSKCSDCGTQFLGERIACGKCGGQTFEEVRFSDEGEIYVFSVVHQGVEEPFIGAIVDLKDGPSVRATISGLDPLKVDQGYKDWFGTKVKMYTEKVATDREGNDVIAAKFKVA